MVPTTHGADFDAIRVVLVDKQAVGVFYTHRSYGQSAVDATSEWAKKNAADVEQQLLRFDASHAVSSAKGSATPSPAADNAGLPAGTIKKGTLTSPQLMRDTMQGVVGKVATLGCDKIEDVTRYVVTPFSGAPRSSTVAGEVDGQGLRQTISGGYRFQRGWCRRGRLDDKELRIADTTSSQLSNAVMGYEE